MYDHKTTGLGLGEIVKNTAAARAAKMMKKKGCQMRRFKLEPNAFIGVPETVSIIGSKQCLCKQLRCHGTVLLKIPLALRSAAAKKSKATRERSV
ncbi:MAG: hypothetical protein O7A06_03405 [Acidobacteria bacterium]|nr:hypothetical protein [Acidobacteriota bacterium]